MAFDTFGEGTTYLSITRIDGSDIDFKAVIETVDISGGAKDFDQMATIAGGRLVKHNPEEPTEITLEGYAVEMGSTSTTGNGFYDLMYSQDTTNPISISADHAHDKFRLVIMATDNTSQSSATGSTSSGDNAIRWVYQNGFFTNVNASYTDGVWKFTITYKVTPFDKSGNSNYTFESTDGTASETLSSLSAYSS